MLSLEVLHALAFPLIGAGPVSVLSPVALDPVSRVVHGAVAPLMAQAQLEPLVGALAGGAGMVSEWLASGPALAAAATAPAASATADAAAAASHHALRPGELPLSLLMLGIGGTFLGTLAISKFSLKIGVPAILGVLILGLIIDPNVEVFNHERIATLHTLSLSMLLFYAGLKTQMRSIRGFLEYGVLLALAGVISTSLILGIITWFTASPKPGSLGFGFMELPLSLAMLVGACLGSIDAGATVSVLGDHRSHFPPRLRSLLQFESSLSDPLAILFVGLISGSPPRKARCPLNTLCTPSYSSLCKRSPPVFCLG